jgi:prepilin-type processing-associated H-X9-DG protein
MNNGKQLMLGWTLYAGDNEDKLVNNFGVAETIAEINTGSFQNWVNNVMSWGTEEYNTNVNYIRNGILAPYTSAAEGIYKCPADVKLSNAQRQAGWTKRARSLAMNAFMGPFNRNRGDSWATGANTFQADYRQFLKVVDIPSPVGTFVTLDEHPNTINDGYYLNTSNNRGVGAHWGDIPAQYHNGACGFSFADGHSEIKKWVGAWASDRGVMTIPGSDIAPNFEWLWERTSVLRK